MSSSKENMLPPSAGVPISEEDLANFFGQFRERLERMVEFRMDPRIRNRIDPTDLLQDSFLECQRRLQSFNETGGCSVYVWIRQMTLQKLIDFHRASFRQKRNVGQEFRLDRQESAGGTSLLMANQLIGQVSTPSRLVSRQEEIEKMRAGLELLEPTDQEVLALRHFEQLSNKEAAEILGLTITAASNRYVRAMSRLAQMVDRLQAGQARGDHG